MDLTLVSIHQFDGYRFNIYSTPFKDKFLVKCYQTKGLKPESTLWNAIYEDEANSHKNAVKLAVEYALGQGVA